VSRKYSRAKNALLLAGRGRGWGRGKIVDDGPEYVDDTMDDQTGAPSHIVSVRRTKNTKELAFFHALPNTFWDEVIHDYELSAILDIAVGDGSLARTTVRNQITYTGFAFTDKHRETSWPD
ncbi:MAG: hypothetical protein ACKPKO_54330, partial [Candidatus Fonsibacter sp.]